MMTRLELKRLLKNNRFSCASVLFALFCAVSLPSVAQGQWATSAANLDDMYNTNAGKVGSCVVVKEYICIGERQVVVGRC